MANTTTAPLKGLKLTKQRQKILELLLQNTEPVTAEELYHTARIYFPSIALTTIYRNLERLEVYGYISKIMGRNGVAQYELIGKEDTHKHFLVCMCCNKIIPLKTCPIPVLEKNILDETGFQITGHHLELYGYCNECKKIKQNKLE